MALAAVACQSLSCEGDYPIAPTLCDDWCHTSEHVSCGNYELEMLTLESFVSTF